MIDRLPVILGVGACIAVGILGAGCSSHSSDSPSQHSTGGSSQGGTANGGTGNPKGGASHGGTGAASGGDGAAGIGGRVSGGTSGGSGVSGGSDASSGGDASGGGASGGDGNGAASGQPSQAGASGDTSGDWWKPTSAQPIHWHWQLSTQFTVPDDLLPHKTVFDLDGETTSAETVAKLHSLGSEVKVICYFDAGVYESYRSDAPRFPKALIGKADEGWEDSFWLDIRALDQLLPILRDRAINWCQKKGFDAIEPDETEVWSNDSGFPITKEQNDAFNRAVAEMVHSLGMSVGLKGNNSEAAELEPYFDWALTEQCWEFQECDGFRDSFVAAGKAVFNVEYDAKPDCALANRWHINSSRRDLNLVGPRDSQYLYQPCIPDTQDSW